MDDKTLQVLTILLRSPFTAVLLIAVMWALSYAAVRVFEFVIDMTTKPKADEFNYRYVRAEWTGISAVIAWALAAVFCGAMFGIVGSTLSGVVSILVMPEYLALRQLLK